MEYAQVTYRLFVGSHPQTVDDIERLRRDLAITAILNLQTDEDMVTAGLDWEPLEVHYSTCPVVLFRVPMKEEQGEMREKLFQCIGALERLLSAGHTVYLHCTAGIGRSPTVAVGYLHYCMGWELNAAARYVKEVRKCSPHLEALGLAIVDQARIEAADWWSG
jgi:protein-tyrosine phosphatase